jgi:queuosine precursor transporter
MKYLLLAAFAATIPAANWLIGNVGTTCIPDGPCLIPVGFGLMAPSGVLMIGLALVFRDAVHEHFGAKGSIAAIGLGAALSMFSPGLAIASAVAFIIAELADLIVYAKLRQKRLWLAVLASGVVGAFFDSAVFNWLAFNSLEFSAGNAVGKIYASLIVALGIIAIEKLRPQK